MATGEAFPKAPEAREQIRSFVDRFSLAGYADGSRGIFVPGEPILWPTRTFRGSSSPGSLGVNTLLVGRDTERGVEPHPGTTIIVKSNQRLNVLTFSSHWRKLMASQYQVELMGDDVALVEHWGDDRFDDKRSTYEIPILADGFVKAVDARDEVSGDLSGTFDSLLKPMDAEQYAEMCLAQRVVTAIQAQRGVGGR